MTNRRDFILSGLGSASAEYLAVRTRLAYTKDACKEIVPNPKSMRILILGGSGFIGPHHVNAALARGHHVAVFNRGKSEANLPPEVERLRGNRDGDLESIRHRDWDAVIDTAADVPRWIQSVGEALRDRVGHYTFISTVMTYARNPGVVTEVSDTLEFTEHKVPSTLTAPQGWVQYGSLKVLCEREALKQFPNRTLISRCGVIDGPGDGGHVTYWLVRMQTGGEILAPGDPLAPVQLIDVRDLAEWIISMIERRETGTYNAVGPTMEMTMAEFLGGVRSMFSAPVRLTWVSSDWLTAQGIQADEAPFFWEKKPDIAGKDELWVSYRVSNERAVSKGLRFRPLASTLVDNLTWYRRLQSARRTPRINGWKADVEARLLKAWRESNA